MRPRVVALIVLAIVAYSFLLLPAGAGTSGKMLARAPAGVAPLVERVYTPVADATVSEATPGTPLGTATSLQVAYSQLYDKESWALLRFDISDLPECVEIESATLEMWLCNASGLAAVTQWAVAITQSWNEGSVTWNNKPSVGSWPMSTVVGPASYLVSWDVRAAVANWYAGTMVNHGLAMQTSTTNENARHYYSREAIYTSPPRLRITYTQQTCTATPTNTWHMQQSPTRTPTVTQTWHMQQSPTRTPTPTQTWHMAQTATRTRTPIPTNTSTATHTPTATNTPSPTLTLKLFRTPSTTPTRGPTWTPGPLKLYLPLVQRVVDSP